MSGYSLCMMEWIEDVNIKNELRLLLKISSLTAEKGYCYASNEFFSKYFETTDVTISRQINKLKRLGYLSIESDKDGAIVKSRKIRLLKTISTINKNDNGTVNKNVKENNIIYNNIIYNAIDFDKLLDFIKTTTKRNFQLISPKVRKEYENLLKIGYSKDNIIDAIRNSVLDKYHKETKFKYLTPEYFSRSKTIDSFAFRETKTNKVKINRFS